MKYTSENGRKPSSGPILARLAKFTPQKKIFVGFTSTEN